MCVFFSCMPNLMRHYPQNATVRIDVRSLKSKAKPRLFLAFEKKLNDLLAVYAEEKKDFNVMRDSVDIPSHTIYIEIDSLMVTNYEAYLKHFQKIDKKADRYTKTAEKTRHPYGGALPSIFDDDDNMTGQLIDLYTHTMVMENRLHAYMNVNIYLADNKSLVVWGIQKKLETSSYEPIHEGEQIQQLFSILESFLREEIGFFKL
ncbi:MAG: hypothetical protein A2453_10445 [Candidatus Raymondbacteria bacterium RIFOXYC2_FULL_50_21]|nr:MAG: hypothetical protein A2453_10445 [Candidatus Raymondbacteria bacterium RIFOXYC2_FULL_50_21]